MIILQIVAIILASIVQLSSSKIFKKCELARELKGIHGLSSEEISTYVCIAEHQSQFNTNVVGSDGTYYGMFQISSEFWCSTYESSSKACNMNCDELIDDNLDDDIQCVRTIIEEHNRISGNGYTAWPSGTMCQSISKTYLGDCSFESNQVVSNNEKSITHKRISGNVERGKVYERCELARELRYQHNIHSINDIATWVCIAKHESNFNTSAIGRLNWDGSEDHGIFQISDIYWCGGDNGKGCGLSCEDLRDNDIKNDVGCIQTIHEEHTRLFGDGFQAWAVYPRCKGQSEDFIQGCFDSENEIIPFRPQPGIIQPTKKIQSYKKSTIKEEGKIYERCELARELKDIYKIPDEQIATWICIAKHESNFNTSAIGRLNWDGSEDHGLFQISDIYWCSKDIQGKGCNLACSELEDSDISNDVECMLKIHQEHTYLSGDGFNAWTTYPRCKGKLSDQYVKGCFDQTQIQNVRPGIQQPIQKSQLTTILITEIPPSTTTETIQFEETTTLKFLNVKKEVVTTKNLISKVSTVKPLDRPHLDNELKQQRKNVASNKSPSSPVLNHDHKDAGVVTLKKRINEQKNLQSTHTTLTHSTIPVTTTTTRKVATTRKIAPVQPKIKSQFDIFAFYLNDYTSKPSIDYKPIQFNSKKSSVVTANKKSESLNTQSKVTSNQHQQLEKDSKNSKVETTFQRLSAKKSLLLNLPLNYYGLNGNTFAKNKIGGLVGNITPHSIDYLLKLTTPKSV